MGSETSKEKFWATKLEGMEKEAARYFIQDNDVYWQETGEKVTEIRVTERNGIIYEYKKDRKPGRLNVGIRKHHIVVVRRMG